MNLLTAVLLLATITVEEVLSSKYHGPTALPVVLHNGYLADTHEVAAAKSAHLSTLSHQSHGGSYGHQGDLRYHGPISIPNVLHDGHIADTHEVAAAKAEHYAAVAKARAHGGYHHGEHYSGQHSTAGVHHGYSTHASYHGPISIPHVLHDGHIEDTHEVAAAKAEHFAAVAKARAHADHYSGQHSTAGVHHGYSTHASYHGPIAIPNVLHDGHIADTHEVAAAKAGHYAAVAKARAHGGFHLGEDYSGQYAPGYSGPSGSYH